MPSDPVKPGARRYDAKDTLVCDPDEIAQHVTHVLQSPPFARAPRMQRFLSFLVDEMLAGRSAQLKEYTIAVAVYDKPPEFEPGASAGIRVEAGRLRKLLMAYSMEHGYADSVVLEIPKGSYVPQFRRRTKPTDEAPVVGREVGGDTASEPTERVGSASPTPHWAVPAERRQVTVLSCAICDDRDLIQGSAGQELLTSYDAFYEQCAAAAAQHGGTVDGAASDRVIIYFGWPNALEDAAGRALTAALDMLAVAQPGTGTGASSPGVRIGVATSDVIIRDVSAEKTGRAKPAVVGEAPVLATKILQRAPLNGILVAEGTRRLTGAAFELIPAGQLEGTSEPPELIWRLLKPRQALTRYRASHVGAQQILVGRREEAALLESRWRLALEGEGQGALITGEAGIGKSKLAEAVLERFAVEGAALRLQCSPHHTNSTLYPFVELIKREIAEANEHGGSLEGRLDDFRRQFDLDRPLDGALLDALLARSENEALRSISAGKQKDLTLGLLTRMLAAQASSRPTAVLIEDVHWADPTTLELVQDVLRMASSTRLLVLLTSRQELQAGCVPQTTSIRLTRLPRRESNELIDRMVSDARLPADARTLILEKADGVPLFLEELTKLVLGADERRMRESRIPESLSGLLTSQLDRLGRTRSIAQLASIVGREITAGTLALAASCPVREIEMALDQLAAAGIMVRAGREDSEVFSFRHALLRDAAYGSILEPTRRELHLRVARLLIASFPQIVAAHPEVIAHHLADGGRPEDAIPHWIDAGHKAAGRYALAEAITDFRLALAALRALPASFADRERELQVLFDLGLAIRTARGYGDRDLLEIYQSARALAAQSGNLAQLANAVYGLWTHAAGKGEWRTAMELAMEFERLTREVDDGQLEAEAFRLLGASAAFMGDLSSARRHFEQALATYEMDRHGPVFGFDPGGASAAYLAWTAWHLGDSECARQCAERAIAIAEGKGHPPTLAMVLSWLIFYQVCTRDIDAILEYNRRLQTVCAERDCRYWQPFGAACAEWAAFQRDGSDSHLEPLLVSAREFRERYFTSCLLLLGADLCLTLGRPEEGLEIVGEAARFVEAHDERVWEAECSRYEAELMLLQNTPTRAGRAKRLLQRALRSARAQNSRQLETRALRSLEKLGPRSV